MKITLSKIFESDAGVDALRGEFERYYKGVDLYGLNAFLKVKFPDDSIDKFLLSKSVEQGKVVVSRVIDGLLSRIAGKLSAQIVLEGEEGNVILNSAKFTIDVNESVADETNHYTVIPSAVMELQRELQGEVNRLEEDIVEIETFMQGDFVNTVNDQSGDITLDKSSVGLSNVDNTSDLNKPISTATQAALDKKLDVIQVDNDTTLSELDGKGGVMKKGDHYYTYDVYTPASNYYVFEFEHLLTKFRYCGEVDRDLTLSQAMSLTYEDNYALESELNQKQDLLTFDSVPTSGSNNPVKSGGVYSAINEAISSVYRFKGSVATFSDLPSTGLTIGDVYNVLANDKNYAWTGTQWDDLGGSLAGLVPDTRTVNGHALSSDVTVTKSDIGLSNVDNTSDLNKPISTATQAALNQKVDLIQIHPSDDLSDIVARANSGIIRLYISDQYYTYNIIPDGVGGCEFEIESLFDSKRWAGAASLDTLFVDIVSDDYYQNDYALESDLENKEDKLTQSTDLSSTTQTLTLSANTRYALGTLTALNITFPASGNDGDAIIIEFVSGSAATTLTRDTTNAIYNFSTVSANAFVEFNAEYKVSIGKWVVYSAETEYIDE